MRVMHSCCAGLDVHQKTVTACALMGEPGSEPKAEKCTFGTSTHQLLELNDWLAERQITAVAMESTGTYWRPVWAILEGHFDLTLANAAHIKQVGRQERLRHKMGSAHFHGARDPRGDFRRSETRLGALELRVNLSSVTSCRDN